ncbi:hypothetical protein Y032_0072g708 [Ancylostoma ceylanicum]|uniref:Uncharacterized protein n=1 Tax=Ancylostoma ceylanicum TaxID=53326 RepID=A0A016TX12_9BILA|nr:hypothetical protein Y032_0072g708 [Ancylostoma ceylanicum]
MSYFRGQPVYPYNYGIYTQPSYGYNYYNYYQPVYRSSYYRPYYRRNWETYPDPETDEGTVVYYDNSYSGGGILGAAGALIITFSSLQEWISYAPAAFLGCGSRF